MNLVDVAEKTATGMSPFLAAARALAPTIEAEAAEIERNGDLTDTVVSAMKQSGLFWMLVPREAGGGGASLVDMILVIEELSRADGSTGWSFMATGLGTALAGAFCSDDAVDEMFGSAERAIAAGMLAPVGRADLQSDGSFIGNGSYSFASGSAYANWIGAGMTVYQDGKPRLLADGSPDGRTFFLPREKVQFRGNWDVTGLNGTGSYDYGVVDQPLTGSFSMERFAKKPFRGGAPFIIGHVGMGCAGHAAVVLGLMKRALEEIARISKAKKRVNYPGTVADHPVFLHEFGEFEALYQATRRYVVDVFDEAENLVAAGGELTAEHHARFRQSATWSHHMAIKVVAFCHLWGGSASIRRPSVLGRCLQDVHVASQHVFVDPASVGAAAADLVEAWAHPGGVQ